MKITFLGYSEAKTDSKLYQDAYETARLLAKKGFTIVNGGGPGVMQAATEGAHAGGGRAIGVYFNPAGMTNFEGRDPNNNVDREIEMPNYVARTIKLLDLGEFYVIFRGGTGTISEFGMAWGLARLYFGNHKPMVLFGRFWQEIIAAFKKNMLLRPEEERVYRIVERPQEVLVTIRSLQDSLVHRA